MDPVRILRQTPVFRDLRPADIEELVPHLRDRRYARGQAVWIEGDRAAELCVVAEGQLKAHRISRDGRELIIGLYEAGAVTGEVGMFHPARRRWLSLTAMTESRCLVVGRSPLVGFLSRHPVAMQRMLERLSTTAVQAAYSYSGMVFDDIARRVATRLLDLTDEHGEPTPDGLRIRMRLSQGDLAAHVAASRENVNRALSGFVAAGVVSQRGGHFYVHDRAALGLAAGRDPRD